jgi:transposase-like protein
VLALSETQVALLLALDAGVQLRINRNVVWIRCHPYSIRDLYALRTAGLVGSAATPVGMRGAKSFELTARGVTVVQRLTNHRGAVVAVVGRRLRASAVVARGASAARCLPEAPATPVPTTPHELEVEMTQPNRGGANRGGGRRRRWNSPAAREDMTRRYVEERKSMREIAREVGCSYGTVHMVLTSGGVTLRPRGGSARRTAGDPDRGTSEATSDRPDVHSSRDQS